MKPAGRALYLVGALLTVALLWPDAPFWNAALGLVAAVYIVDALLGFRRPSPDARRRVPPILPVRSRHTVALELVNPHASALRIHVQDAVPVSFKAAENAVELDLSPGERVLWEYEVQPTERGPARFGQVHVQVASPLGLWWIQRLLGHADEVRVYPDFRAITQYLHLVADQQSQRLGLRRTQRRGEGLEFQQLREFRDGDSIRQIDWKATARRRELISREYAEERDQGVVFMLDTGGRMRAQDGALSHFDHALNALLLLAYVALRQGDVVSLQTFGPTHRWIGGLRGVTAINRLLNELYDLQSEAGAGDYTTAAETLMAKQRKRSLVVMLTNLRQADSDLLPAVQLIRSRHAVLVASLRERSVDDALKQDVVTFDDALTVLGANRYQEQRRRLMARLATSAQLVRDCTPDELPAELVNGYWSLKRAGVL